MITPFNITTGSVIGETIAFADCDEARLAFPAKEIHQIKNTKNGLVFTEGKDFSHVQGTCVIKRLPGSTMPFITYDQLHPAVHPGKESIPSAIGDDVDGKLLLFDNKVFFAGKQCEVDYTTDYMELPSRSNEFDDRLPRFRRLLSAAGSHLRMTFLGDSITDGFNSSKMFNIPPFQPPYPFLVGEALEERCGIKAEILNRGVNGTSSNHPLAHTDKWLEDRPDLLVIAFGMNDMHAIPIDKYLKNIADIIAMARSASLNTEILLVATMPGNPRWQATPLETAEAFSSSLHDFALQQDAGVAFLSQFHWWKFFMDRKNYYDMTGNGVNHPNDFGHRLLAENIARTLILPRN